MSGIEDLCAQYFNAQTCGHAKHEGCNQNYDPSGLFPALRHIRHINEKRLIRNSVINVIVRCIRKVESQFLFFFYFFNKIFVHHSVPAGNISLAMTCAFLTSLQVFISMLQ